jgi:type IV secretion system protein VirD4
VDSDRLEEDCAAFARLFIAETKSAGGGSAEYFQAQAMNLLAGLLYLVAKDRDFKEDRKLTKVRALVALPTKEMTAFLARKVSDKATPLFVRENLGQFVGMADQTFSGVLSSVAKDTAWLSIPAYAQMVTRETFALSEIPDGNLDVFIQVPGETLMTYPAIGRVIVGAITKAMVQANGAHKKRLLLVLDEVDLLGYMSVLTEVRDRGRKYGMTLMMLYQSIGQVENHYGKEGATSWLEGCSFVSYAAIKSMETAEAVSERCGDMTVDVTGQSDAYAPLLSKRDPNRSTSTSLQGRKLILPHEVVQDMRADEQIVMVRGHPPLRCGRAIYFRRKEMVAAAAVNRFAGKAATLKS